MNFKLENYFKKLNEENHIGHAFLIGNVNYMEIEDELKLIFNRYFFYDEVAEENNPDIYIVEPEKNNISKEKILDLQNNLNSTSQIHKCKIYIIKEADKMNKYASNSMLKFLEEPSENIYAFLITTNVNKLMETIKSRCQLIFINTEAKVELFEETDENIKFMEFIELLERKKVRSIAYYPKYIKGMKRDEIKEFINKLLYSYGDILNIKMGKSTEYFNDQEKILYQISSKLDIMVITRKIKIVSDILQRIDNNTNTDLVMDKLIIELGRC